MSLERLVRVAAVSLLALDFGLSAFIGCGLAFAGLRSTCGLGMAKMPWDNRKPSGKCKV